MSVYVDQMQPCIQNRKWPYDQACHLVADSTKELHKFGTRLGLHFSWFQAHSIPHYDLTVGMRRKAVKMGAIEISRKKFTKFIRKYHTCKTSGQPGVDGTPNAVR